jgi:hypothetical protein
MRFNANVVYEGIGIMEVFCLDIGGLTTGQTIEGSGELSCPIQPSLVENRNH